MGKRTRWVSLVAGVACLAATAVLWTSATGQASQAIPLRDVTVQEAALLYRAEQLLIKECMIGRSLPYWVVEQNPVPEFREFPYVLDDVAWARAHGYGADLERRTQELSDSHPNRRYFQSLPPPQRQAWLGALYGNPSDERLRAKLPGGGIVSRSTNGCVSDAERRLYGDLATWHRVHSVTLSLTGPRRDGVVSDPRFTEAVTRWSTCLRGDGYTYGDPDEIRAELHDPDKSRTPAEWGRLAVAEATCADSTGLAATARVLDLEYARRLRDRYPDETTTTLRLQLAALPRARSVAGVP